MLILDLNQVMISNLMMSLGGHKIVMDENLLRHMILNTIRSNLVKFRSDFGNDLIIACDDKNYWRKSYFPYYKANRKKNRDASDLDWNNIFQSLNKIRDEIKDNFPYRTIQVESAEADDIIGTLCNEFGTELGGEPILIISGDKDFVQLQKYSNVSQYDPVRKRWLKNQRPTEFLYEHIIKGDAGDGVPNFLSEDDIFISEGRQRPVTSKKLKVWVSELLNGKDPAEVFTNEELRNWNRNRALIDLEMIPSDISEQILEQYNDQENRDRSRLFNYFIANKLKNLTEKIGEF
jgi:hypothetical protein